MAESRERTAEEREAARLERERRRSGGSAPVESVPAATSPPPPSRMAASPPPPAPEFDQPDDRHNGEPPVEWQDPPELASGTRRVGWRERGARRSSAPPAAPRAPRRRLVPVPHSRGLLVRAAAVAILVLAVALIWFCASLFQPFHGSGEGSVSVTIPAHSGTSQIGSLLERDGVVSSGFFFTLRATLEGDRGKLLSGTYRMKRDMSYAEALSLLSTPPPAAKVTNVTIVPGKTRAQLDALLRSQGVSGSYLAATRHSPLLTPSAYGAPASTPSLEGFLFPDTYQLREPLTAPELAAAQLAQFRKQFATVSLAYAQSKRLTAYDVLIIASIIEKEAATAHDRPLVASVIYNRLKAGIALGMDSTTRYEFNDYTKPLTSSQLSAPSPYNTRLNKGLPPTPIGNPGLSAIQAAAHPAVTNYLYFVAKPCGNGASVFSSDYNQFLADSARYQSARAQRAGRSLTNC